MGNKKKLLILACIFTVSLLSACSSKTTIPNKEEGNNTNIEVKNPSKETPVPNKEEGKNNTNIEVKKPSKETPSKEVPNKETTPISNKEDIVAVTEDIVAVTNDMPSNEINEYIGFNMSYTEIRGFKSQGKTYILILAGKQNTGGYSLKVDKITKEGDLYNVNVVLSEPEEGMMTTQVISTPTLLLQKNTDSKVKINLVKKGTIVETKTID